MIKRAWKKYCARKSKAGMCCDFLILLLVIFLCAAPLRMMLHIGLVRLTACQPNRIDDSFYVNKTDTLIAKTSDNNDTCVFLCSNRPTLYNFGSLNSAQSRAELRSLNKLALKYKNRLCVLFLTDSTPDEVIKYFGKHGYIITPVFLPSTDDFLQEHDIISELRFSVPASLLVNSEGKVIIKKFGAAKWIGNKIEQTIDEVIADK